MSSFINPLVRHGNPEKTGAIKLWTRQTLGLTDEAIVSVSEMPCVKPNCPRVRTVILVLSEVAPTRQVAIRKPLADVAEIDVQNAWLDFIMGIYSDELNSGDAPS
ncbi:MAG: hypothetical protein U1E56_04025 [Bauldia sp.]